jgi:uncharacterized protein (TIGR02246 family)
MTVNPGQAASLPGPDDPVAGATAAYAAWFAGLEAGDAVRSVAAVTEDVVHQNPAGERRVGRAALRAALEPFFVTYVERVRWSLTVVSVGDGEAEVRVREEATLRPRAGGPSIRAAGWHAGRVRPGADGMWRIAADVGTVDGRPTELPMHEFDLPGAWHAPPGR